jgi:hypothetical protein
MSPLWCPVADQKQIYGRFFPLDVSTGIFFISLQENLSSHLSSQRVLQLLPYKISPIRTSKYTTSPVSSPIFAFVLFAVFLEEKSRLGAAKIWGYDCSSDLLGGCWCHGGAGTRGAEVFFVISG